MGRDDFKGDNSDPDIPVCERWFPIPKIGLVRRNQMRGCHQPYNPSHMAYGVALETERCIVGSRANLPELIQNVTTY